MLLRGEKGTSVVGPTVLSAAESHSILHEGTVGAHLGEEKISSQLKEGTPKR